MRLASLRERLRVGGGESQRSPLTPLDDPLLTHADEADRTIVQKALAFSMTGPARLLALVDATRYCVARGVPGAFAECGVWRGGSVLAMILTLQSLDVTDRDIYLYDTFEGMTTPTDQDTSRLEGSALEQWRQATTEGERPWSEVFGEDAFTEDAVRELLLGTGYAERRLHFVRGPVEETIPGTAAQQLALLRLDTDWYESTRHELVHLFPRLSPRGALIVDDYGHWQGARRAVDEYFAAQHPPLLLSRVDYSARMAIKQ